MPPLPIYDNLGAAIGWYLSSGPIYDLSGKRVAVVLADRIFGVSGKYRGAFLNRYLCDDSGRPVAFTDGATGGPALPISTLPLEAPPQLDAVPAPPEVPLPFPPQPELQKEWSGKSWREWLGQPTHIGGESEEPLI